MTMGSEVFKKKKREYMFDNVFFFFNIFSLKVTFEEKLSVLCNLKKIKMLIRHNSNDLELRKGRSLGFKS